MDERLDKRKLRDATLELIRRVNEIHRSGSGSLPLADLIALFGLPSLPDQLGQREEVSFTRLDDRTGTFTNQGAELSFNAAGLSIQVPRILQGEYESSAQRLALRFDPEATISGRKLIFRVTLRGVIADEGGIDVDVHGPIPLPITKIRFD